MNIPLTTIIATTRNEVCPHDEAPVLPPSLSLFTRGVTALCVRDLRDLLTVPGEGRDAVFSTCVSMATVHGNNDVRRCVQFVLAYPFTLSQFSLSISDESSRQV